MLEYLKYKVGFHSTKEVEPEELFHATVPGAVQLDYANANHLPPYYYADNFKEYEWMEDVFWTYVAEFEHGNNNHKMNCWLVAKGIDSKYDIVINGEVVFCGEGMFTPVEINIEKFLKPHNKLKIVIYPVPKVKNLPKSRIQASQTTKPAVSYGWDWHPRLIPSGIWDDLYLEYRAENFIIESLFDYKMNPGENQADIHMRIKTQMSGSYTLHWKLLDTENQVVTEKATQLSNTFVEIKETISNISLWWPHDYGEPYLYTSQLDLLNQEQRLLHRQENKIGFRTVEMVMNDTAWEMPAEFPKSRSVAPAQMKINGRKIFLKGTNWVNPDIFFGRIDRSVYQRQIDLAYEANFNVLRAWGGSIVNKESFYEYCDEKGMLVWQDFPLACNDYKGSAAYLSLLKQEASSILLRLRDHVCIALWCGGNELFNSWSGMDDQSQALRLLNALCLKHTPQLPFIATTPLMGMGHGHYVFRDEDTGEEVFQMMKHSRMTAYPEFGMPGPSNIDTIKQCIPQDELFPPKAGTSWEVHHAFNAWNEDTWLCTKTLQHYFGKPQNLDELIRNGQLLQGEGIKFMYEEARRQKPYCAMALHWCFNEPWPTAANNSIINWPDTPKPAYYEAGKACRPVLVSASFEKFQWEEGALFEAEIWLLNDTYREIQSSNVNVFLECNDQREHLLTWKYPVPRTYENIPGPIVRYRLPKLSASRFHILLEVEDFPEYNSGYTLLYKDRETEGADEQWLNR